MKQSNEQTVADAEKALSAEGKGGYVFRAIQGRRATVKRGPASRRCGSTAT
jgi:hypothetical protein